MTTVSVVRKWDPLVVSWLYFCATLLYPICDDSFIGKNFEPNWDSVYSWIYSTFCLKMLYIHCWRLVPTTWIKRAVNIFERAYAAICPLKWIFYPRNLITAILFHWNRKLSRFSDNCNNIFHNSPYIMIIILWLYFDDSDNSMYAV